jgi:hypothetical protein
MAGTSAQIVFNASEATDAEALLSVADPSLLLTSMEKIGALSLTLAGNATAPAASALSITEVLVRNKKTRADGVQLYKGPAVGVTTLFAAWARNRKNVQLIGRSYPSDHNMEFVFTYTSTGAGAYTDDVLFG